ncbi:hypothetical protein [Saccharothrix coeruleofusca]|uniref:Uncharacterized protein n=1 Tax=Saccharothrix coeruleofusca TaxID=33919 RepID=A0A918EGD5_9PSEU|nr:hypothetical protein [Saccharothrix coeruleofusca]GGP81041.1 hypothetical protein GCM10010185_63810 [Saccharothrix coeruleofusca]
MSDAAFRRSLLVCCDLRRYSAADDHLQRALQELLVQSLDRAGRAAGLDRARWVRQPKGDEEWAVLPPDTPEPLVVDRYVRELDAELRSVNRYRVPEAKLRMRLAVHFGVTAQGANGFPGQDAVLVSRLLDSPVAKRALEQAPDADLVVVLSEVVYDSLVRAGRTTLDPAAFRRVAVSVKDFTGHAWLWLPSGNAHALRLEEPAPPPSSPSVVQHATASGGSTVVQAGRDAHMPTQRADVVQHFDRNDQRGSHFGPVYGAGRDGG